MDRRVFRICRKVHAKLNGLGAKKGWRTGGISQNEQLFTWRRACLSRFSKIWFTCRCRIPVGYVCVTAVIPTDVKVFDEPEIHAELSQMTDVEFGDAWLNTLLMPGLRVRPAVVPGQFNYLLNPLHADFARIVVEPVQPFDFDRRLFG